MATDPLWIDATSGSPSYSGAELRLNGVVPFVAGAGASLGVRSGVRQSGSGTDLQVAAQTSPNMSVRVFAGVAVIQGAISATQGAYCWSLDATTTVTIAAAHATLSRTDLIAIRVRDSSVDTSGQKDASVIAITGTAGGGAPSLPSDATYFELARVSVGAAVTTIVTGNITDRRAFMAAAGGFITCTSSTRPSSPLPGQRIWETDTAATYPMAAEKVWNGTFWDPRVMKGYISGAINVLNSTTLVDATGLVFPAEANGKYLVTYELLYAAGTGDMKIGWTVPASTTVNSGPIGMNATSTDAGAATIAILGSNSTSPITVFGGTGAANPWYLARVVAYVKLSSTAGTVQFRFAQNTADAGSNTTLFEGSFMTAVRVA